MKLRFERLSVAVALCWLVYLAVGGQSMQQGQFVAFEAAGLMAEPPEAVTRVTLASQEARRVLEPVPGGGWTVDARPISAATAPRVALAVKFLHTARPLRELGKADQDPAYGFADPGALRVEVERAGKPALVLVLGKPGSEATTQYVAEERRGRAWLMSRFVGEEWEAVWAGVR